MNTKPDGRQSRWDQHKLERRALIIDAAIATLEETPAGEEIHVQTIAEKAGLGRSVVYRHFDDRADLDRAVQARALQLLREQLIPEVTLEGSIDDIILRILTAYVGWAAGHPVLHRIALTEQAGEAASVLESAIQEIADSVHGLFTLGAALVGVTLSEDDQAALDPMIFGLVGQAVAATRHWLSRPTQEPSVDVLADLMRQSVWFQVDGLAKARGVELDPTVPLEDLLAAAFNDGSDSPSEA